MSLEDLIKNARKYMKPSEIEVVVYHKNCNDGDTAALCAYINNPTIHFVAMQYPVTIEDIPKSMVNKNILVLDFSFCRDVLEKLRKFAKKVMILDHHISAINDLQGVEGCFFDIKESGASLSYYYFNDEFNEWNDKLPLFIEYVKDRDLWNWNYRKYSEPMFYGLMERYPRHDSDNGEHHFKNYYKYLNEKNLLEIIKFGNGIVKKNDEYINEQIVRAEKKIIQIPGNNKYYSAMILELKSSKFVSEISERLYTNNNVDFTVCWTRHPDNRCPEFLHDYEHYPIIRTLKTFLFGLHAYTISLRSSKNSGINVADIAKALGGGGHEKAAGVVMTRHPRELF